MIFFVVCHLQQSSIGFIPQTYLVNQVSLHVGRFCLFSGSSPYAIFSSFLSKMLYSGFEWANGFTLQYYLARDGLRWGSPLALWFADHHGVAWVSQWTVFVIPRDILFSRHLSSLEMALPSVRIFFSSHCLSDHARRVFYMDGDLWSVLLIGRTVFHSTGFRAFSPSRETGGSFTMVNVPLCIRSMTILQYGDWFERIRYSNVLERWETLQQQKQLKMSLSDFLREMYLVMPDGLLA